MMRLSALICLWFMLSISLVQASVVINEISPDSEPEWIELFNAGENTVDLTGYTLVDDNNLEDDIVLSLTLGSREYYVATNSGKKTWLNNSGDTVTLYDPGKNLLDQLSYTSMGKNKVVARVPDESDNTVTGLDPTMGLPNPTPTPAPADTPDPTPVPTPDPTPPPASSPSLTPTPRPSPKPSPSPSLSSESAGTVAGETTEINLTGLGLSPTPSPADLNSQNGGLTLNRTRAKNTLFVGSGLILISLSGYLGYREYLRIKESSAL